MLTVQQLLNAWNAVFHGSESAAPLVLFRILIGALLLVNALLLIPLTDDYYSSDGVWPTRSWKKQLAGRRFSILHWLPDSTWSFRILLLVHLVACLLLLAGWHFRPASVVVFLTLVSLQHRNTMLLSSGDSLLRMLLFLTCFSSAGGGLSVDHWLAGRSPLEFDRMDPWPLRLMQILLSIVYLRTVYWKLRGSLWRNGTAAWYPLWVDAYVRFRPPRWLLQPRLLRLATWGTLCEETALGIGLWIHELRFPLLVTGVVLHLIFDLILNLQLFSWIMIISLLLFLSPAEAESALRWLWG
ncbi:MAG: HTTM domain-containing protein [Planctomycetaceae bacterium]